MNVAWRRAPDADFIDPLFLERALVSQRSSFFRNR
jgi:hypothetical protein